MKYKGEIKPEALSLLLRLTSGVEMAQEILTMDTLKSEYWQGIKDTVLMYNEMLLEKEEALK